MGTTDIAAPRSKRLWAWVPALAVATGTVLTAAGISLIPHATAATGSVNVTGSVDGGITWDPSSCTAAAISGTFTPAAGVTLLTTPVGATAGACNVIFNTTDPDGATLTIADSTPADPFFGRGTRTGADTFENVADGINPLPHAIDADGEFGVALQAVTNATAGSDFVVDAAPAAIDESWAPVDGTSRLACQSAAAATATCQLVFGGDAKATQAAGNDYTGTANLVATVR